MAVPCLVSLYLVSLTWHHSMFPTNPGLLISISLCKRERKAPQKTGQYIFLIFFPFLHYFTLHVLNICQGSPPKIIAFNSTILFNSPLGILIPLFLSNFISLFYSSAFFTFPPAFYSPSHTPAEKKTKRKKKRMDCILTIRITVKQCSWDPICCQHISQDSKWWAFLAK